MQSAEGQERSFTDAATIRIAKEPSGISRPTENARSADNFYWKNTQRTQNMYVQMINVDIENKMEVFLYGRVSCNHYMCRKTGT